MRPSVDDVRMRIRMTGGGRRCPRPWAGADGGGSIQGIRQDCAAALVFGVEESRPQLRVVFVGRRYILGLSRRYRRKGLMAISSVRHAQ
jgi:hypothetical protein